MVLLVFAAAACGEKPTGPEAADLEPAAAFKKPEGVGKPGGDLPLTVVFAEPGGADKIHSDGGGEYVHGEDLVSAVIRDVGMLYFQAFDGKKKEIPIRGVAVNLGSGEVWEQTHFEDFVNEVERVERLEDPDYTFWPDATFTSDVTLHTRKTEGGMYFMPSWEESSLVDAGKIAFNDYGDASWEWRLLFGARIETPEGGVDHYEAGLCITHPDPGTWYVMTDGTKCGGDESGVDDVTELWRFVDGDFIHVADFTTPMHLTLTRK
jgi:hypothetical protein